MTAPTTIAPFITITGIDERTDISAVAQLQAEVGILFTATPEGRNRYPRMEWIAEAVQALPRVAIHVCGWTGLAGLVSGDLDPFISQVQRIQVNGVRPVSLMEELCHRYPSHTLINQFHEKNSPLLTVGASNHALLFDSSGGRGISPTEWTRPATEKPFGFAGGMGPENLTTALDLIMPIASGSWWVDMEGRLRTDDWFSVEKASEAVAIFHATVD